jgi:hypothetical protein
VVRDYQVVEKRLVRNLLQDVRDLILVRDDIQYWHFPQFGNDVGSLVQLEDSDWLNLDLDEVYHLLIFVHLIF